MAAGKSSRAVRFVLLILVILLAALVVLLRYTNNTPKAGNEETLDRVLRFAERGQILSVTLLDEDNVVVGSACSTPVVPKRPPGAFVEPGEGPGSARCPGVEAKFHAPYPRSGVVTLQLIDRISEGAPPDAFPAVRTDRQTTKSMAKFVANGLLPLLILAALLGLIFLSRGGESSIADIAGFGRITRRRQRKQRAAGDEITFANVAGADEAVAELSEVNDYLHDPRRFQAYGASPPKGVLLFGPPGCGKTLLARAVAGEAGVPFFAISGAEFVESLVGVGAARVRDLFEQVREVAPAIVFIDEIDAVGRRRGGEGQTGGEREQTVNQLLIELDGFDADSGIVLIGATNRPDILDPALMRPGRFDRHITVEAPDVHGREAILKLHARSKPMAADVDFEFLARRTPGFTGADLFNVINEAALLALRDSTGVPDIKMSNLTEAIQRVLHGPQRRGKIMTAEERKRIAFHEAGHALVSAAVGHGGKVQRISVVARGRGLGQSVIADDQERVIFTTSELSAQLMISMGGMAAEELTFGEPSTAGEHDVERATELARQMVGRYGMSAKLGRVRVVAKEDGFFGGDGVVVDLDPGTLMEQFHEEVRSLIQAAEEEATRLLSIHVEHLEKMVERLEKEETLEGAELQRLLVAVRPETGMFGGKADGNGAKTAVTRRNASSSGRTKADKRNS